MKNLSKFRSCLIYLKKYLYTYTYTYMENFIEKSNEKFKFKFDFINSKYVNSKTKIEFICKNHREKIFITPEQHLQYKFGGCRHCKFEKRRQIL